MSRKQLKEAAWAKDKFSSGSDSSDDDDGPGSGVPQKKPLSKKNHKKLL